MKFLDLLGRELKSHEVVQILETYGVDVVYEFDRHFEGMDDLYWASFYEQGFQFGFDQDQRLHVIFLYMKARDGFTPIPHEHIPVPVYQSFAEAKEAFDGQGLEYKISPIEDPAHRFYQRWIKGQFDGHTVHYEFADGQPRMITLHWTP